jgi:hypothetical protein
MTLGVLTGQAETADHAALDTTTHVVYSGVFSISENGPRGGPNQFLVLSQTTTREKFYASRTISTSTNTFPVGMWHMGVPIRDNQTWPVRAESIIAQELTFLENGNVFCDVLFKNRPSGGLRIPRQMSGTYAMTSATQVLISVQRHFPRRITDFSVSTKTVDPQVEPDAFEFIPTPASCQLNIVTSNTLVWTKYNANTTVYLQNRYDQKPFRIVQFSDCQIPPVTGFAPDGAFLFRLWHEYIVTPDGLIETSTPTRAQCFVRDARTAITVEGIPSPSLFSHALQRAKRDGQPAIFSLRLFGEGRRNECTVDVKAVPNEQDPVWRNILAQDSLPDPELIATLWPIGEFDKNGVLLWDGVAWVRCNWTSPH